jgi:PAS domain S-box-containing protein
MKPSRSRIDKRPTGPQVQLRKDPRPTAAEFEKHLPWLELFEQAPEAAAILMTDNRIVRVNKEFARMFGYESKGVEGLAIKDVIVPSGLTDTAREYSNPFEHGGRIEVETLRKRKDGTELRVSLIAVPIATASGDHIANYVVYRDITEQKRAEEQLRESEARFQVLADTAPVMIWMTGTDGICNYFNKPWCEFTGRTLEQEVGLGWLDGVYADDVQGCLDGFLPAFHARKPFRMEYRLRRADGEYRWVIESGVPRYTLSKDFAGYIGSNIDITDLKRAEEQREKLRQIEADLSHISHVSMMGELAASLAHEINQPITASVMNAKTCVRWLQRDTPEVHEACEAASRMINDVVRAADIIDRVRSLYTRDRPQREAVDLNNIIRQITGLLLDKAKRNSVSIRANLSEDLPTITADRVQLQQVLMNLMLNAIEAMQDMGGELRVASEKTGDHLLISVSDSGTGLPAGEMDRMFDAFFTTKPQGTGMGLSISRKIVESHGGRLWASTNSARGATFQFTLPIRISSTSAA